MFFQRGKLLDRTLFSHRDRLIEISSVIFAIGASTFGLFRQLWAWPDTTWQTTLYYLKDIDLILSGSPEQAIWFELGNGHAMSGYRIFTYLNALFFGLDSRLELIVYWAIILSISIVLALIVTRNSTNKILGLIASIVIVFVMNSLAGAGARGMELGTFAGALLMFCLALLAAAKVSTISFFVTSALVVPVAQFFFLGGYMAGWVFSLVLVMALSLFQNRKMVLKEPKSIKLLALGAISLFWMAVFYLLIPKTHSTLSLFDVWEKDIFFPIKYIIFGFTNSIFTSQSFEFLATSDSYPIYLTVGIFVFLFCLAAILGSLQRTDSVARIGQVLTVYGFGTSILLLFTRAFGDSWLLSPWYSFHFKLTLCGAILLFVTSRFRYFQIAAIPVLVLIAALSITSSKLAFDRNPHERSYFQNIQKATYFPETIADRGDGNTQLIAGVEESLAAVEILRKHKLGVYRPGAVNPDDFVLP
jgi:hypothetical protein